jgi:hypothetical protein
MVYCVIGLSSSNGNSSFAIGPANDGILLIVVGSRQKSKPDNPDVLFSGQIRHGNPSLTTFP